MIDEAPRPFESLLTSAATNSLCEHLDQCLKVRWRKFRRQIERSASQPSEKEVHQLRVEARRVMAVLAVLHSIIPGKNLDALECGVKEAFRDSARLRDNHVRALLIETQIESFSELKPLRKVLRKRETRLSRRLQDRIGRIRKVKLHKLVRQARKELRGALHNSAIQGRCLTGLLEKVNSAHRRVGALLRQARNGSPARIHRVRIAFKKFRYLVEVLEPLIAGLSRRELRNMRAWQDAMGEIQDTALLRSFVAKRARKRGDPALSRFRKHLDQRQQHLITKFLASADDLLGLWPPSRGPLVRRIAA